jgi:S1-C subfamily serine protease
MQFLLALLVIPGGGEAPAGPALYQATLRGTAWVVTPGRGKGTGWLLDRHRRLLVTCHHVVGDHDAVEVHFPAYRDGAVIAQRDYYVENKQRAVRGRVVHREKASDLALVELDAAPADAAALPLAAGARPGEAVHGVGNRRDLDVLWTCSTGVVRQAHVSAEGYFWQGALLAKGAPVVIAQAPILEGDSGGPLVNDRGEVVGVVSAVRWQAPLATVCIDAAEVRAFVARAGAGRAGPPGKPAEARDGAAVYERAVRSLAWVRPAASTRSAGWVVDAGRRLLLTSHQAVAGQQSVDVVFPAYRDGKLIAEADHYRDNLQQLRKSGLVVRGHVLARDAGRNLALLDLESLPDGVPALSVAETDAKPGARLHALGHPNGVEALWVYSAGSVRQVLRTGLDQAADAPDPMVLAAQLPFGGDSGGPVLDDRGQVVAVAAGKDAPQQLVSFCTAASEVRSFLDHTRARWDPRRPEEYLGRAEHYRRTGRFALALADCDAALRLDAKSAAAHAQRALVRHLRGESDQALADCAAALRLDPGHAPAHCHRAAVLIRAGKLDEAAAACAAALRSDARSAAAYCHRGNVHRLRGELGRALADCDEALLLDGRLGLGHYHRGLVYAAKSDLERAMLDWLRAVELEPVLAGEYVKEIRAALERAERNPDLRKRARELRAALADVGAK